MGAIMSIRDFSDSVKFEVIKKILEKNNGQIRCEICGKNLSSITDCHFDHIYPFAKGGKSTLENCQLLCADCNLKKNDKELKDFILEEKTKAFLSGKNLTSVENEQKNDSAEQPVESHNEMNKDLFDKLIFSFIQKKGNISKVDFGREYNKLPSIHYVRMYYGDLNNLKKSFGIEDLSFNWNRDNIKKALIKFVEEQGDITQKDMKKSNRLPSIPCVLNYYPEYRSFTDIKRGLCNLTTPIQWTKELAIEHGKKFANQNGRITQKDLKSENNLPSNGVINSLFGSLANYQLCVGCSVSTRNEFISKEEIAVAVETYFGDAERVVESQSVFYESFKISPSTISKRYGTFADFCKEHNIKVLVRKKAKYSKREVDDIISKWVKEEKSIPTSKDLTKLGLPSSSVILKYYENWKEPFYIYMRLYEEINRH